MNAITKSLERSRALVNTTTAMAWQLKGSGMLNAMVSPAMMSTPSDWQQQSKNREAYAQFRSWVYSAVHALAGAASSQPVEIGKVEGAEDPEEKGRPSGVKREKLTRSETRRRGRKVRPEANLMTKSVAKRYRSLKASGKELEVLVDHKLAKILEHPNPLQHRFQFVYSFVANLCLTGRCYIVKDESEGEDGEKGKNQFYCLPSTWVRPDRSKWPKMQYRVINPRNIDVEVGGEALDESQVAVAYLPNPADPMGCYSPAGSQSAAIRIDDRIQTCEEKFFDNGIFPSVVVTVGKDPHPDVPGGIRPRLSAQQRRQVVGAIRRVMGSVANYGNPAIVDGLIESVTPFSMNARELGWDRSEDKIKDRILCAFGVHPLMIGQALEVGGYAQAAVIQSIFCNRVNMYLDLLSTLMTEFVGDEEGIMVWWEAAAPEDPSLKSQEMSNARSRGDVTQNEWRSFMGLPPDEDKNEQVVPDSLIPSIAGMLAQAGIGQIRPEQVEAILKANGIPDEAAAAISGVNLQPEQDDQQGYDDGQGGPEGWQGDETMGRAVGALQRAVAALRLDAKSMVGEALAAVA